jgi:hypothetical protein
MSTISSSYKYATEISGDDPSQLRRLSQEKVQAIIVVLNRLINAELKQIVELHMALGLIVPPPLLDRADVVIE